MSIFFPAWQPHPCDCGTARGTGHARRRRDPLITALVLVLIVGVWAIIAGLVEFMAAFQSGESAGTRAMFILGGLASAAFGAVLCARPGIGAITLALLFGLFNLIAGIWMLAGGIELRRTGKTLHSVPSP